MPPCSAQLPLWERELLAGVGVGDPGEGAADGDADLDGLVGRAHDVADDADVGVVVGGDDHDVVGDVAGQAAVPGVVDDGDVVDRPQAGGFEVVEGVGLAVVADLVGRVLHLAATPAPLQGQDPGGEERPVDGGDLGGGPIGRGGPPRRGGGTHEGASAPRSTAPHGGGPGPAPNRPR